MIYSELSLVKRPLQICERADGFSQVTCTALGKTDEERQCRQNGMLVVLCWFGEVKK